jgi:hypothetical protein
MAFFVDLSRAKPHPKDRAVEPDDPMNLHAVELDGDPNLMLRVLVEEYARMGCDVESLLELCREPFYRGFHGLLLHFGEEELRRRIIAILARCGVTRVRMVREQPADEQLVQIALPSGQPERGSHADRL